MKFIEYIFFLEISLDIFFVLKKLFYFVIFFKQKKFFKTKTQKYNKNFLKVKNVSNTI